jgi:hypothetical protein
MAVGTAFDYLLRFVVQRLNPHAHGGDRWVAEHAVLRLARFKTLYETGYEIVSDARMELEKYKKSGKIGNGLIKSALLLATLDPIVRANVGHENIGVVAEDDIRDLKKIASLVDEKVFTSSHLCLLNPTFGAGSLLVGGADADLVIDKTLIDIKTTKKFSLDRPYLNQVIGYYILHTIGGVGELKPKPVIENLAIYFSRHGYLHTMPVSELIDTKTFPKFVRWFKERAQGQFEQA